MDEGDKLGKILLRRKLVSADELEAALKAQAERGTRLASQLTQSGVLEETDALRALSEQYGVPGLDLRQLTILLDHLDFVPLELAESNRILPVLAREDRLFLAMANPRDRRTVDELEFVTGKRVYPYVAMSTALERTVRDAYEAKARGELVWHGPDAPGGDDHEPPSAEAERRSVFPGAPPVVVDELIARAAASSQLSIAEIGNMTSDVSRAGALPSLDRLPEAPGGTGPLVLVVDDEDEIRALVRHVLERRGCRILEAENGNVALRLVKEHVPDLIVLDAMLPEVHGFDIAKRIRGSERYGTIPILMMSAVYRGWRIREDLRQSHGIEEYLEKPFRLGDLAERVDRLLAGRERKAGDDRALATEQAEACLVEGVERYKQGDLEGAVELLVRGTTIDPLAYRLRYHLALIYGKDGRLYEAIAELERAVDLNAGYFPGLKNLAILYEKAGFRHKAVETWERSLEHAPDDTTREGIKAHLLSLL